MPTIYVARTVAVERSSRVMQLEGLFDIPPSRQSTMEWRAELPIESRDWRIGLIVGPSGCGKSTLAREIFGDCVVDGFDWPRNRSLVDGFPAVLSIKEIVRLLTSVGFSSPPAWLRPYRVLSTGEQFRATLARAMAEATQTIVIDEFTSVVDRTVARIGSAALAKAVRQRGRRFVAVTCHEDVVDWLQPDWIFEPASSSFQWRTLQRRPLISLEIVRVDRSVWPLFKRHHYLSGELHSGSICFAGLVERRPAVFSAVIAFPHAHRPGWREHRTVCLPDFQGVGLGNAMSEYVASLFQATGRPYRSVTSNPAMIHHRARSNLWLMTRPPSLGRLQGLTHANRAAAVNRLTASFRYVGPARPQEAEEFGILADGEGQGRAANVVRTRIDPPVHQARP